MCGTKVVNGWIYEFSLMMEKFPFFGQTFILMKLGLNCKFYQ